MIYVTYILPTSFVFDLQTVFIPFKILYEEINVVSMFLSENDDVSLIKFSATRDTTDVTIFDNSLCAEISADISAQSELSKMVTSVVSRVAENFISETSSFSDKNIDTTLISSYKILKGMKTVCRSKTKLVGNMYVTYITKEISLDDISDMLDFNNDDDRNEFKKMLMK